MQPLRAIETSLLQNLLVQSDLILEQPIAIQLSLAQDPHTPRSLLEVLVNQADAVVSESASFHVNWVGKLAGDGRSELNAIFQNAQLGQNDRLAVELLKLGAVPPEFLSKWVPAHYLIQALKNPYVPLRDRLKFLERLAQDATLEPRLVVAESSEVPLPVLERLVGDLELSVRLAAKHNPCCPPALVQLVEGQQAIAADWETGDEELDSLGQSAWAWIRLTVAQNPSTGTATLMRLATDSVFKVQLAVARNPSADASILAVLIENSEAEIQKAIAVHRNATETALLQLLPTQKGTILERKNLPASTLQRLYEDAIERDPVKGVQEIRHHLLQQPNTPEKILKSLSQYDLEAIRDELVSRNLNPRPDVLEGWVIQQIGYLAEVARHPNVSAKILERLAECSNSDVQLAVVQNLNISNASKAIIERLSESPNLNIRLAAALNPSTPGSLRLSLLTALVAESSFEINYQIAQHLQTPVVFLEQLAGDLNNKFVELLFSKIPSASPILFKQIGSFFETHGAAHQLTFQLRESAESRDPILQTWQQLIDSLEESDREALNVLGRQTLPLMGLSGSNVLQDQVWLGRPPNIKGSISANYILYGILLFSALSQADTRYQAYAAPLMGNPNTPTSIRNRLWEQFKPIPNSEHTYEYNWSFQIALALNPAVPQLERLEYQKQVFSVEVGRRHCEQLARSPKTQPYVLAQLAQTSSEIVRNYVAGNSVTLPETLVQLVRDLDIQVRETALKNPKTPWLEEHQQFLLSQYAANLAQVERDEIVKGNALLARRLDSPYALAQVVERGDRHAKITIARNPKTPIATLEQLAQDADETIRQTVTQNKNVSEQTLTLLSRDPCDSIRCSVAINLRTPASVLERLSDDTYAMVKANVAGNPNTPSYSLRKLALSPSSIVQTTALCNENIPVDFLFQEALRNPKNAEILLKGESPRGRNRMLHIPAELLEQLAERPEDTIRYLIANHPNTSASTLEKLAFDSYDMVRRTVAENPNTPIALLVEMASQEILKITNGCYHTVSRKIATRKDATAEALDIIIRQPVPPIQQVAAANPHISTSSLEWLIDHTTDLNVLSAVILSPKMTDDLFAQLSAHPNPEVLQRLVSQPNCPNSVLEEISLRELFSSSDPIAINSRIAANPNTSVSTLQRLCSSSHATIRAAIATNPSTPLSLLEELAQDEKVQVRRAVTQNANASDSIRERLRDLTISSSDRQVSPTLCSLPRLYNSQSDDLPTILAEYIHSDNAFVRLVALLHPLMPVEILEQGARSQSWLERYAVAENPATPSDIRQQLALDGNRIIRAVATNHQPQ